MIFHDHRNPGESGLLVPDEITIILGHWNDAALVRVNGITFC